MPCSSKLGHALTRSCSGCWVKDHPCDDLAPPSEHHVTSAGERILLEDQDSVALREKHKLGGPDVRVQRRLVTVVCNNIDGEAAKYLSADYFAASPSMLLSLELVCGSFSCMFEV